MGGRGTSRRILVLSRKIPGELAVDPYQINNLAEKSEYAIAVEEHRNVLKKWSKETDDKGQYPESSIQLKATYDLWIQKPIFSEAKVNPEYDQFRN